MSLKCVLVVFVPQRAASKQNTAFQSELAQLQAVAIAAQGLKVRCCSASVSRSKLQLCFPALVLNALLASVLDRFAVFARASAGREYGLRLRSRRRCQHRVAFHTRLRHFYVRLKSLKTPTVLDFV